MAFHNILCVDDRIYTPHTYTLARNENVSGALYGQTMDLLYKGRRCTQAVTPVYIYVYIVRPSLSVRLQLIGRSIIFCVLVLGVYMLDHLTPLCAFRRK